MTKTQEKQDRNRPSRRPAQGKKVQSKRSKLRFYLTGFGQKPKNVKKIESKFKFKLSASI